MKQIEEADLDCAISLGDAICNELGICCEKRGDVIFRVYKKLQELRPHTGITGQPEQTTEQPEQNPLAGLPEGGGQEASEQSGVGSEDQQSLPE